MSRRSKICRLPVEFPDSESAKPAPSHSVLLGHRGSTLVEVLLAMFLLTLGCLGIAQMFIHASRGLDKGRDMATVGSLAVQRMELVRAAGFTTLNAGGSLNSNASGYFDTSTPGITVRWLITDDASPATRKTIQVRAIAAALPAGASKEVILTAMRAR